MGRALRTDVAGYIYHVLNSANARAGLFAKKQDYQLFESILEDAVDRVDMRLLVYTIMPNHWHLVLQPRKDGDLQKFMNWLTLTHTQRWHAQHGTTGYGHLYQGRYKSFLCESDAYFLQLTRYIERNPLRANLIDRAEAWQWGSAYRREQGSPEQKRILSPISPVASVLRPTGCPSRRSARKLSSLAPLHVATVLCRYAQTKQSRSLHNPLPSSIYGEV